jgi:hypothetical protein
MIEKFFTQSEWFGINFSETIVNLDPKEMASSYFYSQFYRTLEEKYGDVSQLPKEWLEGKRDTAKALSQLLGESNTILSYGCGIGIVEKYLIEDFDFKALFGFDLAKPSKLHYSHPRFNQVTRIEELEQGNFDRIYLCQVLYALDKDGAIQLLKALKNLLKADGFLILVHTSIFDSENGISKIHSQKNRITSKIRRGFQGIPNSKIENEESKQGWGYQRDNEFYEFLISSAGFETSTFLPLAGQSFIICQK